MKHESFSPSKPSNLRKKISRRAAARFYNVPESTIRDRMNGVTHIAERRPAVQLLTEIEEDGIVQYILDLDTRGFPPRVEDVDDMANYILSSRGTRRAGELRSSSGVRSSRRVFLMATTPRGPSAKIPT